MNETTPLTLAQRLTARFGDRVLSCHEWRDEITLEIAPAQWLSVATTLRDESDWHFEQLIDVCGVDYLSYGQTEWDTADVSAEGFSRGVEGEGAGRFNWANRPQVEKNIKRYAVVVHLLSIRHNQRLRLRCRADDDAFPMVPSLVGVWKAANWFEREVFDLFGIIFDGHPDLRRLLTDYGFVGHPFRKDFPLVGNVEVRYDAQAGRVIYEPVSIEPRVLVPRTIRHDSRYEQAQAEQATAAPASGSTGK